MFEFPKGVATSESTPISHAHLKLLEEAHQQLGFALAKLDEFGLYQAGAYVAMAMDAMERRCGDAIGGGGVSMSSLDELLRTI